MRLFGLLECDIHVPDNLKETSEEMTPLFRNTDVRRSDIEEFMKEYMEKNKLLSGCVELLSAAVRVKKFFWPCHLLAKALL